MERSTFVRGLSFAFVKKKYTQTLMDGFFISKIVSRENERLLKKLEDLERYVETIDNRKLIRS